MEQRLARIAGNAHGLATRRQLLDAGITASEIKQRLRTGALLQVHRGVYRVGHKAPSMEATFLAAVLACGPPWEQDRRREREARARCDEFRRYTYGDVFENPGPMLSELRRLLPTPSVTAARRR